VAIVGLVSSYREGALIRGAVGSLAAAGPDRIYVVEGSAGMIVPAACPETDLGGFASHVELIEGAWPTDAAKRTGIVKRVQADFPDQPIWGVWVDGDEVLRNGEFLRDLLQAVLWKDEAAGASIVLPDNPPTAGFPIRLVEMDGSVVVCRAKVLRVDLVSNYVVSSSGIKFKNGVVQAEGNLPDRIADWWVPGRMEKLEKGERMLDAPLPCEPFLWHRSPLRHPARASVRMHQQETVELARMGVLDQTPR